MAFASFCVPNQVISPKRCSTTRVTAPGKLTLRVSAVATSSTSNSLYEVLGIQMGATFQEIKTAYRSLARITHPDAVTSSSAAGDEFIRLHSAYSTLSDPKKRADYDRKLFWGTPMLSETRFSNYSSRSRNWETDQCW
ncbi:chaperone [Lithospermum erythrorhizon]|uniref:Chaperone n=1 Tax=Lithospermum erythrorhizon TaxID=34254 RepID=A0AAV3PZA8_LITER